MYIHLEPGDSSLLFTVAHDGRTKAPGAAIRNEKGVRDVRTLDLARATAEFLAEDGLKPTLLWTSLHRSHADMNRGPGEERYAVGFAEIYEEFHAVLSHAINDILARYGRAHLMDIHGCAPPPHLEAFELFVGSHNHRTCPLGYDLEFVRLWNEQERDTAASPSRQAVFSAHAHPDPVIDPYPGRWITESMFTRDSRPDLCALQLEFHQALRTPVVVAGTGRKLAAVLQKLC